MLQIVKMYSYEEYLGAKPLSFQCNELISISEEIQILQAKEISILQI